MPISLKPLPRRPKYGVLALSLCGALACAHGDTEVARDLDTAAEIGGCATILMPGDSVPMGNPSCAGDMSFLGGASDQVQEETEVKTRTPGSEYAKAPVAVLGYPVKKAGDLLLEAGDRVGEREASSSSRGGSSRQSSSRSGSAPESPQASAGASANLPPVPVPVPVPTDPQARWENDQLAAMERELEAQQAAPSVAAPPRADRASTAQNGRLSIAQELAMLQDSTRPEARPRPKLAAPARERATEGGVADFVGDRDGDGRPDHWIYSENDRPLRELYDENGDGQPDRTIVYDLDSGLEDRVEEDRNLDGQLDSWSDFDAGKLTRHRRDTDFDGQPDAWSYYHQGQLERQELDLNGDGFRNRVAFYRDGRLVREREDRDGDGRIDRVTFYDAAEHITQRDEDQDGDGRIDVRSIYENGRLVRREMVSEVIDAEELATPSWSEGAEG